MSIKDIFSNAIKRAYKRLDEGKEITVSPKSDRYTYDFQEDTNYDKNWKPETAEEKSAQTNSITEKKKFNIIPIVVAIIAVLAVVLITLMIINHKQKVENGEYDDEDDELDDYDDDENEDDEEPKTKRKNKTKEDSKKKREIKNKDNGKRFAD